MAIVNNKDNQIIWARLLEKSHRKVLLGDGPTIRYSYDRFIIQKKGARFGLFCILLTVWLSVIVSFCLLFSLFSIASLINFVLFSFQSVRRYFVSHEPGVLPSLVAISS